MLLSENRLTRPGTIAPLGLGDISNPLDTKGMTYEIIDYYGRDAIKLTSGVVIDFDEEENECGIKPL